MLAHMCARHTEVQLHVALNQFETSVDRYQRLKAHHAVPSAAFFAPRRDLSRHSADNTDRLDWRIDRIIWRRAVLHYSTERL